MRKVIVFLLGGLCFIPLSWGVEPTRLTTDLLEHTDRIFLDGYLSGASLSESGTLIERYQTALIRNREPRLGWVVNSNTSNTLQTAYRILLATSPDLLREGSADMWDSGRVESDNSVSVRYEGRPLQPSTVYYWKVKTWTDHDQESGYSHVKSFITAAKFDGQTARYPLQISEEYPQTINRTEAGCLFVDFGKAAFGRLRLTLTSSRDEDTVVVHLGEYAAGGRIERHPKGSVRYSEYRLPLMRGTHTYTLKIRPDKRNTSVKMNESGVKPAFMPNYIGEVTPFRYCEIENYSQPLSPTAIIRQSVHYPFDETASEFYSSDTTLNQVWELCKYSMKATSFAGIFVDGDRERIPYEADALLNQLSYYAVDREFSIARHSHEHLIFHATWPTEWILQSVLMAYNDYLYTGNTRSLERFYTDLKAKTLSALQADNGLISTRCVEQSPELLQAIHFGGKKIRDIVDWPQKGVLGVGKKEPGEADNYQFTDYNTVVNAYHYRALSQMSLIAAALGKMQDSKEFAKDAERVKQQINRLLLDRGKGYYRDGIDTDHSSLHANMFPLAFGIVPPEYVESVKAYIRSRGMACSVYGSQFLLDAVYDSHDAEYGLQLLASSSERSWYNMIRAGSTITMEAWDNKYKPNQDWNHAWGAAPANLIPRKLMGIEPLEPGFAKIRIKPQPATLKEASIRIPTIRGDVNVAFRNDYKKKFVLDVEIPANTTAEVWLPQWGTSNSVKVDGHSTEGVPESGFLKVMIGSGKHSFVSISEDIPAE